MPIPIAPDIKVVIDDLLKQNHSLPPEEQKQLSEISKMFAVSVAYLKKRKQALGLSRPKAEAAPKPERKDTEDTGDTEDTAEEAKQDTEGYTLETPAHGGGKLVRGVHPDGGRKKGTKMAPATLQDIASFFSQIDPTTVKKAGGPITYLQRFLIGCIVQAEAGKERYADLILSALEKSGQKIHLTVENAPGSMIEKQSLPDPLFSAMDDERLRLEAIKVLEARHQQPIEADFKEVAEA
jgi:hypothetical protein